jgi:hypothetical protein
MDQKSRETCGHRHAGPPRRRWSVRPISSARATGHSFSSCWVVPRLSGGCWRGRIPTPRCAISRRPNSRTLSTSPEHRIMPGGRRSAPPGGGPHVMPDASVHPSRMALETFLGVDSLDAQGRHRSRTNSPILSLRRINSATNFPLIPSKIRDAAPPRHHPASSALRAVPLSSGPIRSSGRGAICLRSIFTGT